MSYSSYHDEIVVLYKSYNEVIKPLIAEIEARRESFPQAIYNEIRAFNDHIARCYYNEFADREFVKQELFKAKGHINRIILDCYKFLNVFLYENVVKKFDKDTKVIDLSQVGDGHFYIEYKSGRQFIIEKLKEAKLMETKDKEKSLELYQLVHNKYSDLENLITRNDTNIIRARSRYYSTKTFGWLKWIIGVVIGAALSMFLSCDFVKNLCMEFVGH